MKNNYKRQEGNWQKWIETNCYEIECEKNKDPQTILLSTWHAKLSAITSILKNNFYLISSDSKLSKIFKQKPTVT